MPPGVSPGQGVSSVPMPVGPVLLFSLFGANFQSTADQAFSKIFPGTSYNITDIIAIRRSGAASVVCAGGIYDAVAKGGNALVAAAQSWVTLASGIIVKPTLAALLSTNVLTASPFLSLTTGSTGAITADVHIFGYDIT